MDLSNYKTLVFDCDGVIFNSNKLKTQAFYNVALSYGKDNAKKLVTYHISNGGISRNVKFEIFLREIVKLPVTQQALNELLSAYANEVHQGLLQCELAPGLEALRALMPHVHWMVVSGGNQAELRSVFSERKIDHFFDAGIFGSPDNKVTILKREIAGSNLVCPAVFLGDSRYDHEAASCAGLDFVFVSGWSEFEAFEPYCRDNNLVQVTNLEDLR